MSSAIPVILCGKIPSHKDAVPNAVPNALKTDYEVLQDFSNVDSFVDAFPILIKSLDRKPAVVFMGGGFDTEEFNTAYAVPGASSIPWIRPIRTKPGNEHMLTPGQAPPAHEVASAARNAIDEHVDILRAGKGAGEIWYF